MTVRGADARGPGAVDPGRLRAARRRLLRTLAGLADEAAASSLERCPYRGRHDRCTFTGACRNRRPGLAAPVCGGGALDTRPARAAGAAGAAGAGRPKWRQGPNRTEEQGMAGGDGGEMTSRERMAVAMAHGEPDRVPVMCQLALGHYFLHSGLDPVEIWHDTPTFADALVRLRDRYGFDGILVNLSGRDPEWRRHVERIEGTVGGERRVVWKDGRVTVVPPDDNPHVYQPDGTRYFPTFRELDPERLHYIDPHDSAGLSWPWRWGFAGEPASKDAFFPPWQDAAVRAVRERAPDASVHAEVFSPFSQLLELLNFENALLALMDDPGRVEACLDALTDGTIELMGILARAGADAVLISSAFAGAGFISPAHYERFVLPFERRAIAAFRDAHPAVPVYTHTCGAIGDRLELMAATGTDGIDTLDPPPLGDVELADAKSRVGARLFLKGNMDPVHTILRGTPDQVEADARDRLRAAMRGGGYILSTACSVPPAAPPANLARLRDAADAAGRYGRHP